MASGASCIFTEKPSRPSCRGRSGGIGVHCDTNPQWGLFQQALAMRQKRQEIFLDKGKDLCYNTLALRSAPQYRGVEQLEARRAHNPEVVGSSPASATKYRCQKRCTGENPRFPRVFFIFLAFSRFFKNRITLRLKRCKPRFSTVGRDLNQRIGTLGAYLTIFSRQICPFFVFIIVNSLCLGHPPRYERDWHKYHKERRKNVYSNYRKRR